MEIVAEVRDIKPIRHNTYLLFQAFCLRCLQRSSVVNYKRTYYTQDVGVQGKTFVIFAIGVHSHDGQHSANITRTFTLAQEIVAKAYVSNNTTWSNVSFTNAFRVAGFDLQMLPASDRRSRWLIDHKPRTTSVSLNFERQ